MQQSKLIQTIEFGSDEFFSEGAEFFVRKKVIAVLLRALYTLHTIKLSINLTLKEMILVTQQKLFAVMKSQSL